ncbi:vitelline membrane outer layer protein 1 homolog [Daphnia pulicaria]|uniref:vitelline membrane outer layer protein 1 homolog n=1 Tax=Daphnia pulicaria TaxID=35523 RepID=UPI001EEAAFC5|nr:vitelline membrane outer layer protein 1 homolog [Daphnia pulicaria]
MAKLMKFVALTAVLGCFLPATVMATFWGDWGAVDFCPLGERAVGFSLKTEKPQGDGDDTALNGIALRCSGGSRIRSTEGPWGEWGSEFLCPSGSWLTSCQLRVEPKQGAGDDTSANNLNCMCNTGLELLGDGASQGDWVAWINCPRGIVTIQTLVEGKQGTAGDDTALNDFRFTCWENRPMI